MNVDTLRESLRSPDSIGSHAFDLLRSIGLLLADPSSEAAGHEMVLRALEHRDRFGGYEEMLNSLVRSAGLFPYLDPDSLNFQDAIAYEFHRPENMGDEFIFHRQQAEICRRLLDGESIILSAPTSFGKSKIIDAVIASGRYNNLVVIVPTLALIDETRRRLAQFADRYKIVTHLSQRAADRNIFVFTAERAVAYNEFPSIDLFVIDEFYKLNAISEDEARTVALNQAFYRFRKTGAQFYLLGPNVQKIPDGAEAALGCHFYLTGYTTVASEQIAVSRKGHDLERLVALCKELSEPTLIFCRSPARVNEVAHALLAANIGQPETDLSPAATWTARNYHPEWVFGTALLRGIGIHHGRLPRALAQYVVRMFNDLRLRFLICTSTLIEGVNTKAKNVIIFDNKIASEQIDFFTFNNIKGRSGRMFEHFIGRVFLFNEPPTEQLPFVDFPLISQEPNTPGSLLVQMEDEDLVPASRERVRSYREQRLLPLSVLKESSSIDPDRLITLAGHLLKDPRRWSDTLSWTIPRGPQLRAACELIWSFLVQATRGRGGVFSARQLAFKVWQLLRVPNTADRVRQELRPGPYAAKTPDEAVERVLEFERTWATFELPRYLMALSRVQRAIFEPRGLRYGDYSVFASRVECFFKTPVIAALDEYGIPLQVALKVSAALGDAKNLDSALARLKTLDLSRFRLDEFEKELLADARDFLP